MGILEKKAMTSGKSDKTISVLPGLLFITGIILGTFLWNRIELPFSNPGSIISPITLIGFNPMNDVLRFFIFICLPSMLAAVPLLFKKKYPPKTAPEPAEPAFASPSSPSKKTKWLSRTGLMALALLIGLGHPTYHAWNEFDFFHEGESLSGAVDYLNGKVPYQESLFVHGFFQDPMRSVLAFEIFGKSIGAARTVESFLKILTFALLAILLLSLFRRHLYGLMFLLGLGGLDILSRLLFPDRVPLYILFSRDLLMIGFLLALLFFTRSLSAQRKKSGKMLLLGTLLPFISISALFYSLDRGIYLVAAYLILSLVFLLFVLDGYQRRIYLAAALTGTALAVMIIGPLLRWSFKPFFSFLKTLAADSELTYGLKFPLFKPRYFMVVFLMAILVYFMLSKFIHIFQQHKHSIKHSLRVFFNTHFMEFALLVLSLLFFKSVLGRSDAEHLSYSLLLPLLLGFIISLRFLEKTRPKILIFFKHLVFIVLPVFLGISLYFFLSQNLFTKNFPFAQQDDLFIPEKYQEPLAYLKSHLASNENIYILSSDVAWYYLLDKPSPAKIHNIQMATSLASQKQVVGDLVRKNVRFILYVNYSWDNIDQSKKYPLLMEYIHKNYKHHKTINGFFIWERIPGVKWDNPQIIPSPGKSSSWFPDLAVDSTGTVQTVWCETETVIKPNPHDSFDNETIFYAAWDGKTWTPAKQLFRPQRSISRNAIAVDWEDRLHLLYSDGHGHNYYNLFHCIGRLDPKRRTTVWGPPEALSNQGGTYMCDASVYNNRLHVIFDRAGDESDTNKNADMYYIQSHLVRKTWSEPLQLYHGKTGAARGRIEIDATGGIHLTWDEGWDRLTGKGEPKFGIYRNSFDGGKNWSDPLYIDHPFSNNAQLTCGVNDSGGVMLVWRTTRLENPGIYFSWSSDREQTWTAIDTIPAVYARLWDHSPFDVYDMAADSRGHIHLLVAGHVKRKDIRSQPPQLLHLEWDGSSWKRPQIIYPGKLFPEYPHIVFYSGTDLHVTFFTREQLWKNHDEVKHLVWYVFGKGKE